MKNENNVTPIAPPAITTAHALREIIERFNAKADKRTALTADDRETIATIRDASQGFVKAHYGDLGPQAREIAANVKKYCDLSEGAQTIVVAGDQIEAPAIESATVRALISRKGAELAASLVQHVASHEALAKRRDEKRRSEDAALATAMKMPMLGPSLEILAEAYKDRARNPTLAITTLVIRDVTDLVDRLAKRFESQLPEGVRGRTLTDALHRRADVAAVLNPSQADRTADDLGDDDSNEVA